MAWVPGVYTQQVSRLQVPLRQLICMYSNSSVLEHTLIFWKPVLAPHQWNKTSSYTRSRKVVSARTIAPVAAKCLQTRWAVSHRYETRPGYVRHQLCVESYARRQRLAVHTWRCRVRKPLGRWKTHRSSFGAERMETPYHYRAWLEEDRTHHP